MRIRLGSGTTQSQYFLVNNLTGYLSCCTAKGIP